MSEDTTTRFVIEVATTVPFSRLKLWEKLIDYPLVQCGFPQGNSFQTARDARQAICVVIRNGHCLLAMRVCRPESTRAVHLFTSKQVKQIADQRIKETTQK